MSRSNGPGGSRDFCLEVTEAFLGLLFPGPVSCASCGDKLQRGEKYLCTACLAQIVPVSEPACKHCGRPLTYLGLCRECRLRERSFVRSWPAALYRGALRQCLHRYKYSHGAYLAPFLGGLVAEHLQRVEGVPANPLVVPVPLDRKRLRNRGFNQADLLAVEVARLCNWQLGKKVLKRVRATLPQADLNVKERWANVSGAFAGTVKLKGKEILLIDDIYTTGATADAASRALIEAGAGSVYVATVAIASSHPRGRTK